MRKNVLENYVGINVIIKVEGLTDNELELEGIIKYDKKREEYKFLSETTHIEGTLKGIKLESGVLTGEMEYSSLLRINEIRKKENGTV